LTFVGWCLAVASLHSNTRKTSGAIGRKRQLRSLKEACAVFPSSLRENHFSRTVYHTYIQPAPTQEQAAELLDLPFGTYRRYLKAGVARICELLWTWEISGLAPTPQTEQR
jgi:hypothetical protein